MDDLLSWIHLPADEASPPADEANPPANEDSPFGPFIFPKIGPLSFNCLFFIFFMPKNVE